jgi:predicted transcriptional regulator
MYHNIFEAVKHNKFSFEKSFKVKTGESINFDRIMYAVNIKTGLALVKSYHIDISHLLTVIPENKISWMGFGFDDSIKGIKVYLETPHDKNCTSDNPSLSIVCQDYDCSGQIPIIGTDYKIYLWTYTLPFESKTQSVKNLMQYSQYSMVTYTLTHRGLEWYAYYINLKKRKMYQIITDIMNLAENTIEDKKECQKLHRHLNSIKDADITWISFGKNGSFNIYYRD